MCVNKTYNLVLRSANKLSGTTNSNADFLINWERLLPKEYQVFNVRITMMTNLFEFDATTDPVAIESRIFLGKVSLQDTNNIDSLVHHSRIATPLNVLTENTWYESLNKDLVYTIQRPNNNVITIKNYSFENTSSLLDLATGNEIGYVIYIEFTPIQ